MTLPTIVDETLRGSSSDDSYQRKSGKGNNDINSDQNSKNGYGSMSNENHSPTSEKKFRRKKRKSSSHNSKEELIKTVNELEEKSVKEVINEKFNTKIKNKIGNLLDKFGKKIVNIENEEKNKNVKTISNIPSSVVPQLIDESLSKNGVHAHEEVEPKNTKSHYVEIDDKPSSEVDIFLENEVKNNTEEIKSSNNFDNVETSSTHKDNSHELKGELIGKLVNELDNIHFEFNIEPNKINGEGELVQIINGKKKTDENAVKDKHNIDNTSNILETNALNDSTKTNSNSTISTDDIIENNAAEETLDESLVIKNKNRELFLDLGTEKKEKYTEEEQKEQIDESNVTGKNINCNDDGPNEIIEEIVYVDGKDGDEDEEEIIEITETTTVQESPEDKLDEFHFKNCESPHSDAHKGITTVTTVTKKKIRKPSSSSSLPEEVTISEETVVSSGTPEHNKNPFKFQLGIGKTGVNISVGEKQLKLGKSGVKFDQRDEQESDTNREEALTIKLDKSGLKLNHNQNKSQKNGMSEEPATNVDIEKSEKRDTISPEKVKKPKSNFKIFNRSMSQPLAVSPENDVSKKGFRGSAGLLKFGISRSKSTTVMDMDDITTTDVGVMSSFIDHERHASSQSIADLNEVEKTTKRNGTSVSSGNFISGEKSQPPQVGDNVPSNSGILGSDLKVELPVVEKNDIQKVKKHFGKKSPGVMKKRGKK